MKKIITFLFVCLPILVVTTSLYAQFETAEVLGTVRDPTGAAIPGAAVTLINPDTGVRSSTLTDQVGNYDFFSVKVGRYSIDVEAPGFSKASIAGVSASVNARQRVDVTLQVGTLSQIVEVSATDGAAILETDSSEHGQVIPLTAIAEMPLNGRNYADLALLST